MYFNPRPREEGDAEQGGELESIVISIHALVKRATFCQNIAIQHAIDFNPRPREEGDVALKVEVGSEPNFNPRPREEGDLIYQSALVCDGNFNPRPREEGDNYDMCQSPCRVISIHALVKRATKILKISTGAMFISIHALVKRATL